MSRRPKDFLKMRGREKFGKDLYNEDLDEQYMTSLQQKELRLNPL